MEHLFARPELVYCSPKAHFDTGAARRVQYPFGFAKVGFAKGWYLQLRAYPLRTFGLKNSDPLC